MVLSGMIKKRFNPYVLIGLGVLIYFTLRLITLLTAIENVSWPEELGVGTIAREILLGLKKPFLAYQIDEYAGESLITGLITVPFFKLLGSNLFALKAVTLVFSTLTASITALFLNRHFALKAALWAFFFMTFCPPAFTSHSLIPMNGHSESLLWTVLTLVFFYEFLFSEKHKLFFLFLFGILGGFSFWFCYSAGIAFAACLTVWFMLDRRSFFSKQGILAFCSFLAGLIPWFISGHSHSFNGGRYLFGAFWGIQSKSIIWINARLITQIFFSFPRSFSFLLPSHPFKDISAYGYCLMFIMAISPFWFEKILQPKLLREENKKYIFFLIYPVLFCYAYAVTNFVIAQDYPLGTVAFRYYTPLYFFSAILLSISLDLRKAGKWILGVLLILSLAAQRNVFFKESFGRGMRYNGYSYVEHGARWDARIGRENPFQDMVKTAALFPSRESRYFFWGMAIVWEGGMLKPQPQESLFSDAAMSPLPLSWRSLVTEVMASYLTFHEKKPVEELLRISKALPLPLRGYFYKGIFCDFAGRTAAEIFRDLRILDIVEPEYRNWFYWGLWSYWGYRIWDNGKIDPEISEWAAALKPNEKKWYYRGMGNAAFGTDQPTFFINSEFMREAGNMKRRVPRPYQNDFYWGVGWVIRMFFPADKRRAEDWLLRVEAPFRKSAAEGFDACERWYGLE